MKDVLVDTCIWSEALRKKANSHFVEVLSALIDQSRVAIIGPIRQELLSGLKSKNQFNTLKKHLQGFMDLEINTEMYETAAQYFNRCKSKGIQGSHIDFLICAVAVYYELEIYTHDKDFTLFQKVLPVTLFQEM